MSEPFDSGSTDFTTELVDTDHDGHVDSIVSDENRDGYPDTIQTDSDGDGYIDIVQEDVDGDGYIDILSADTNQDRETDLVAVASEADGVLDVAFIDTNYDGTPDTVERAGDYIYDDAPAYPETGGKDSAPEVVYDAPYGDAPYGDNVEVTVDTDVVVNTGDAYFPVTDR